MKYRKKPVVIDAYQITREMVAGILFDDKKQEGIRIASSHTYSPLRIIFSYILRVDTLEGEAYKVDVGDWIIKGVKGEFYPIKDEIFRETYEPVKDEEPHERS